MFKTKTERKMLKSIKKFTKLNTAKQQHKYNIKVIKSRNCKSIRSAKHKSKQSIRPIFPTNKKLQLIHSHSLQSEKIWNGQWI